MTSTAGNLASRFAVVGTAIAGALATVGIAIGTVYAAGNSLFSVVKNFADIGDNAIKTSQKVGVSVEALQRLSYSAGLAGLSQEGLANGLKFLSKNLVDATEGGKETSESFKKLGIDPKKYLGNTEELLFAIADKIKEMPDGAEKIAVGYKIMGKSFAELIPFLNQGGKAIKEAGLEAELFGLIISREAALQSEQFNDNLSRMGSIALGLKNSIGGALLPVFASVVDKMVEWYKQNAKFIRSGISKFFEKIVPILNQIGESIARIFGGEGKDAGQTFASVIGAIAVAMEGVLRVIGFIIKGLDVWVNSGFGQAIVKMFKEAFNIVFLIIDDLLAFFRGDNSLTGEIIKAGKEIVSNWTGFFTSLFEFLKVGFMEVLHIANQLMNPLTAIGAIGKIGRGQAFEGSQDALAKVNQALNKAKGGESTLSSLNVLKKAYDNIQNSSITNKSPSVLAPASSPTTPQGPGVQNKNIKATGNFNINVPPSALAEEIKKVVANQFEILLRQADNSNSAAAV